MGQSVPPRPWVTKQNSPFEALMPQPEPAAAAETADGTVGRGWRADQRAKRKEIQSVREFQLGKFAYLYVSRKVSERKVQPVRKF